MDEIAVVLKRFGDEQSTLLDQFERLSFEVQLNQAILGRSLSEPAVTRSLFQGSSLNGEASPPLLTHVKQGRRRGSGFNKVLKKLFKPILCRKAKSNAAKRDALDLKDLKSWKGFSGSLRF